MSIYITGDIHGNANNIHNTIFQIKNPSKEDFIIVAGDAGFEYERYIMGQAKKAACEFPGTWIVLRGNHDSRYWNHKEDQGWEIITYLGCDYLHQIKYPNIWYLPDQGCIYHLEDFNILFIPGAYSVDKWYRLRSGYPWNCYEQLSIKEQNDLNFLMIEWVNSGSNIDFVVGHTFPLKMEKYYNDLFMEGLDQATIDKSMESWLNYMSQFYETIPSFKHYFGGHFHDDRQLNDKYTMLYHDVKNLADYIKE